MPHRMFGSMHQQAYNSRWQANPPYASEIIQYVLIRRFYLLQCLINLVIEPMNQVIYTIAAVGIFSFCFKQTQTGFFPRTSNETVGVVSGSEEGMNSKEM